MMADHLGEHTLERPHKALASAVGGRVEDGGCDVGDAETVEHGGEGALVLGSLVCSPFLWFWVAGDPGIVGGGCDCG